MKSITNVIDCLEKTPIILADLLENIPVTLYSERRIKNKWSIHEQVCHLVDAQKILTERFLKFSEEEDPLILNYHPEYLKNEYYYLELNLAEELIKFAPLRMEMVKMLRSFDDNYWSKKGRHEVFQPYSTPILLTHTLNVDYAHLFSIEQLGLTKNEFLEGIMTIP